MVKITNIILFVFISILLTLSIKGAEEIWNFNETEKPEWSSFWYFDYYSSAAWFGGYKRLKMSKFDHEFDSNNGWIRTRTNYKEYYEGGGYSGAWSPSKNKRLFDYTSPVTSLELDEFVTFVSFEVRASSIDLVNPNENISIYLGSEEIVFDRDSSKHILTVLSNGWYRIEMDVSELELTLPSSQRLRIRFWFTTAQSYVDLDNINLLGTQEWPIEIGDFKLYETSDIAIGWSSAEEVNTAWESTKNTVLTVLTPAVYSLESTSIGVLRHIQNLGAAPIIINVCAKAQDENSEEYIVPIVQITTGSIMASNLGGEMSLKMYSQPYPWTDSEHLPEPVETFYSDFDEIKKHLEPNKVYSLVLNPIRFFKNATYPNNEIGYGVMKGLPGYYGFDLDFSNILLNGYTVYNYCGHHYDDDHGDNKNDATPLSLDHKGKSTTYANLYPYDEYSRANGNFADNDVYKVVVNETGNLKAILDVEQIFYGTDIGVFKIILSDKYGTELDSSTGTGIIFSPTVSFDISEPGDYFIEVRHLISFTGELLMDTPQSYKLMVKHKTKKN